MALREEGFWEDHYERELAYYEEAGDEGEVWFGNKLSLRIVEWLSEKLILTIDQEELPKLIDIGCGNGYFLVKLSAKLSSRTKEFNKSSKTAQLVGVDYSQNSIELSKRIASAQGLEKFLDFKRCNFLDKDNLNNVTENSQFDYIVDIGTYDAICLLASESEEKLKEVKLLYIESLTMLIRQNSVMIFASCNHTQDEILSLFQIANKMKFHLKLIDKIETPKMKFGGQEGSQVTCLILGFS